MILLNYQDGEGQQYTWNVDISAENNDISNVDSRRTSSKTQDLNIPSTKVSNDGDNGVKLDSPIATPIDIISESSDAGAADASIEQYPNSDLFYRISNTSPTLYNATEQVTNRISAELKTYFGLIVDIEKKDDGFHLKLPDNTTKQINANNIWAAILAERRSSVSDDSVWRIIEEKMNKMRDFIKYFLKESITIDVVSGGDGSYKCNSTRTSVTVNPFTWAVLSGGTMVNPIQFGSPTSSRIQIIDVTWGPTLHLIHEMEHRMNKTIKGGRLPGSAASDYEEDEVRNDIDDYAPYYSSLTFRGCYLARPEKYTITGSKFSSISANKTTPLSTVDHSDEWVKWPTQGELDNGKR